MRLGERIFVVLILLLIATGATWSQEAAKKGGGNGIVEALRGDLKKRTSVPLRLPTHIAAEPGEDQLYAVIESVSATAYDVEIAFDPECHTSSACHYGEVSGKTIKKGARHARGTAMKLAGGLTGYFVDAGCGASCSDSTLTWDEGSYRYMVTGKAESAKVLVKIANSAIGNKAR